MVESNSHTGDKAQPEIESEKPDDPPDGKFILCICFVIYMNA